MGLLALFGIGPISKVARNRDKALLVEFLRVYGPSNVLHINSNMDEFTRGKHDWTMNVDRVTYALLCELEADGAVSSRPDNISGRVYRLIAPDKLLQVADR